MCVQNLDARGLSSSLCGLSRPPAQLFVCSELTRLPFRDLPCFPQQPAHFLPVHGALLMQMQTMLVEVLVLCWQVFSVPASNTGTGKVTSSAGSVPLLCSPIEMTTCARMCCSTYTLWTKTYHNTLGATGGPLLANTTQQGYPLTMPANSTTQCSRTAR